MQRDHATYFSRFFVREVEGAIRLLGSKRSAEYRYHEARKKLKELRAVLRLVRRGIGEIQYRRENIALRDVGRGLSTVRDAQVISQTLELILKLQRSRIPKEFATKVREYIKNHQTKIIERESGRRDVARQAMGELRSAGHLLRRVGSHEISEKDVKKGFKKTYRACVKRYRASYLAPTDLNFHEWRKSVKHLRHQYEILEKKNHKKFSGQIKGLKQLADQLGLDHDCAVLRDLVGRSPLRRDRSAEILSIALTAKQRELRRKARVLARRLFSKEPDVVTERVF